MYADVILPLSIPGTYTYSVPEELIPKMHQGVRVIVPFGGKKQYTAIVESLNTKEPEGYKVRAISEVLDDRPMVTRAQLQLWHWIADYYLCTIGEVYRAAVPSGMRIESETFVELVKDYEEPADSLLSEREVIVLQTLAHEDKRLSITELIKLTGFANMTSLVTRLISRGAVMISERLVERYVSRKVHYLRPSFDVLDKEALREAFEKVRGAKKQELSLLALLEGVRGTRDGSMERKSLMERADVTLPIVNALIKKGLVAQETREVNRFANTYHTRQPMPKLSDLQQKAYRQISQQWETHDVNLLHGVTASGKTEIYMHLASEAINAGRQVLYLVPEIALTTQLTERLQRVFGDKVVIYHSKFSDNERVDIWRKLLDSKEATLVIGARSALFLPFKSLGLVIVDEEHEQSYKQQDPAPRYNGRDASLVLARQFGAKSLLGSATPAIETYYKAKEGRYGLITLSERYSGVKAPIIEIIDMKRSKSERKLTGAFSHRLRDMLTEAVAGDGQAIVFLNRRGYAPMAVCRQCGYVPRCEHCDVSLTYHKHNNKLTCHYCGSMYDLPVVCPACKETSIEVVGYGTERVEDEVEALWPETAITRMDLDTTRNKDGYQRLIGDFSSGKTKILVGTQMVTKGLDFESVKAVGIVNADAMLNQPDFRASERAFNMMMQVAGRAGRRDTQGVVAIQAWQTLHPILRFVEEGDYEAYYNYELEERKRYSYPPFTRIVYIYIKHKDPRAADEVANAYGRRLRELLGTRVSGPEEPAIGRVQSLYIRKIMLKLELQVSMSKVKELLRGLKEELAATQSEAVKRSIVYFDVDPM